MVAHLTFASTIATFIPLLAQLAAAQSTGTFDFLTYNVAGLPAFLSGNGVPGDKGTNANTIGAKFSERDFDIVHMQEDFNYHAYIYETDDHPYRTATTGGVPFGSGLNTIANYPWSRFQQVKWNACWFNSGDCLTPKGFSFMRMQIAAGVEVDLYNLHADAGADSLDIWARRTGIEQILSYINSNSAGRAVIIGGDTNDRYTNPGLSINKLIDAGFRDPWVDLIKGGQYPASGTPANPCGVPAESNQCEVVDKVFYRSGASVSLSALEWTYMSDFFVQPNGDILSDHNSVHVNFAYSTS